MSAGTELRSEVVKADFFARVGYSTVWEDERIVDEGLAPRAGETALSITSGGDFSLQLLLAGTAAVHSLDFNPRQSWLLHFKHAAVLALDHESLWEVLGLKPCGWRREWYRTLRGRMPEEARRYWDARPVEVERGVLRCGKQDRYLHLIAGALARVVGRRTVRDYFACLDADEQRRLYDERWNGFLWRRLGDVLFGRRVLDFFFHKDHFRYARADQHPGRVIRTQVEHILRELPAQNNFYLHWAFFGTYPSVERCPAWLRASNFARLKASLDRLHVHTGELERFIFAQPDRSIDVFNFSNIFDWVSPEAFAELMRQVARVARPGARLCYWTNAVNTRRELGSAAVSGWTEDTSLGARIHQASRTPGYSSCTIGRFAPQFATSEGTSHGSR